MINPSDVKRMSRRRPNATIKLQTPSPRKLNKPTWPFPLPGIVYHPSIQSNIMAGDNEQSEAYSANNVFLAFAKLWR